MKAGIIRNLLVATALLVFTFCDSRKVFDDYYTLPKATWMKDSVLTFTFKVEKKTDIHNLFVNIRNDQSYGFSNLWLFITVQPPAGACKTDTIQLTLAEPSGKWLGKGIGGIYDIRTIYRRNVYFPDSGLYTLQLRHGMRQESLRGINDVGIRVEKINQ